jgi:FkbM family methyltransferase
MIVASSPDDQAESVMEVAPNDALFDLLRPERLTAIVDVGANPIDGDPPYKRMLADGLCTVIGFEPQAEALAELERNKGPREHYLPYAIGDGRERTLHVCRERGMTSLLAPDRERLALFNEFPVFGLVEREQKIATRRLDDVKEIHCMDCLKVDIQGSELDVFKSARRLLRGAVVVQTEVSFITLYHDQPALGTIDTFLRTIGFLPHCFTELKIRPLAPMVLDGDPSKGIRQLLEADLVYVRDFTRPEGMNAEQWKHLALIAHHCYGSVDLAYRAVTVAARLGAVRAGTAEQYLKLVASLQIPAGVMRA